MGVVTGQFFASARVRGDGATAGAPLAAAVEVGLGIGPVLSGDATAVAGLGGVAGEHAATVTLSSRRTAEDPMRQPCLGSGRVLIADHIHHSRRPGSGHGGRRS